jgi:hypothetical protein
VPRPFDICDAKRLEQCLLGELINRPVRERIGI